MGLQFFHVGDLCRFMELLLTRHPAEHIFNVGNPEMVSITDWARLCYEAAGVPFSAISVGEEHPRWAYFPFRDYEYRLDVSSMTALMPDLTPLPDGLRQEYAWFREHRDAVNRKGYLDYIKTHLV